MDHITLQNHHHHNNNNNHFTLPQQHLNRPSPSASAPLSLLDFNPQDIDLYECLNSQHIPLSAPLSQSINPNNHLIDRLSFALEDDPSTIPSLPPVDQSHLISESSLFGLCPDPTRRRSYPSHTRLQAALPHNSVLTQSTSLPELPLGIDQPHSAPAAPTQPYPPALISIQTQPPSQNPLPRLDTIDSHPVSSRAVELDSNDNEPLSASHNSHTFDPIGLHALFLNRSSQAHSSNQLLLEPFLNAPISPLDHITPLAVSEKSIGTPDARSKSLEPKCNGIATSTLSQDFKKRKGWAKRLVEDIEDVLQLVSPSGKLLFLSESMSRLTGFSTSELLSLTLFDWCFEDEDRVNLKREINNCIRYGNPFSLYCRFKKKGSESFIILEMFGHLADIKSPEKATVAEEKENTQAVYMSGRLYPTSCGQLMDNFLEMMIENEMMARKLQCSEGGWLEEEEGEPEEGAQGEKNKWTVNELTKVVSIADEEESEDEHDQSTERSSHQIIGRDYPSRPRKRPKRDKVDFLCLDCGVTQSPEWRRGPMGRKTLCNACGLRYSKKGSVINSSTTADKK